MNKFIPLTALLVLAGPTLLTCETKSAGVTYDKGQRETGLYADFDCSLINGTSSWGGQTFAERLQTMRVQAQVQKARDRKREEAREQKKRKEREERKKRQRQRCEESNEKWNLKQNLRRAQAKQIIANQARVVQMELARLAARETQQGWHDVFYTRIRKKYGFSLRHHTG